MAGPRVRVVTTRSSVARQWLTKRYVARLTANFAKLSNAVIASVAALQQLGRYRGTSGRRATVSIRSLVTRFRHVALRIAATQNDHEGPFRDPKAGQWCRLTIWLGREMGHSRRGLLSLGYHQRLLSGPFSPRDAEECCGNQSDGAQNGQMDRGILVDERGCTRERLNKCGPHQDR